MGKTKEPAKLEKLTQAEELEALVDFAIDNGWKPTDAPRHSLNREHDGGIRYDKFACSFDVNSFREDGSYIEQLTVSIYDQVFARVLFGKKMLDANEFMVTDKVAYKLFGGTIFSSIAVLPAFRYRSMMAVVSEDPVHYMYQAIFD